MGPLDKDVIRPDGLRAAGETLELQIRSHWYRSLPLSSLAVVGLDIDAETVPSDELTFRYEGHRYGFNELEQQSDAWWYITDPVTIEIPRAQARSGEEHRIRLDLGLSIPYIIVGPPGARSPLLASSVTDTTLVAH